VQLLNKANLKLLIMCIFAGAIYGLAGTVAILVMALFAYVAIGRDSVSKHGISLIESSRLGGLAITFTVLVYLGGLSIFSGFTPLALSESRIMWFWLAVSICALLGLAEDIKPDFLTPSARLVLKFIVFGGLLWFWPEFIPQHVGVPVVDWMLGVPSVAWLLGTVFFVGFINAFNMADGANGLVPGIATACFVLFSLEYGRPVDDVFMFACIIFLIFNVISGWFFLGDMGSYGLGSVIAGYGLYAVSTGVFSASFMAAMLAYPCLDFIVSIGRRLLQGRSPFAPDNDHLHNRIHSRLRLWVRSRVLANSLTGLSISFFTSGLVLIAYIEGWLSATSDAWIFVFFAQCIAYGIVFSLAGRGRPQSQVSDLV
jgi:UDP-N-acetylmuramyl pentapeptide phosphotransferase/UDP-N-acetylglucosamine-1-phosphate transferase